MTSRAELETGLAIVKGCLESFEERALTLRSPAQRDRALHTIKKIVGLDHGEKRVWGRPKGNKTPRDIDLEVIRNETKHGSIPKAVRAFVEAGKLPRRAEKTHVDRINALKRRQRKKG
jgi:hypothetical protein